MTSPIAESTAADTKMTPAEREVLELATPPAKRMWVPIAWAVLWGISVVSLLAASAFLITRASLIIHILWLGWAIVAVRMFALGRAVFRYLKQLSGHDASFRQLAEMRVGLLDRLEPLAPAGLARTRRGDLLSRLVDDIDELQFLPLRVIEPLITSVIVAALTVVGVAIMSVPAALTLLGCLLVALIVATLAQLMIAGAADRQVAPLRAALGDRVHDTITNLETLRAYDALDSQLARIHEADAALRRVLVRRSIGEGVVTGVVTIFAGLATAGALWFNVDATANGTFTPEFLTMVALVPLALFEVFAQVPVAVAAWRRVRVSAQRVATVAPTTVPSEIPQPGGTAKLPEGPLDITITDVSARWPGAAQPAIQGCSVEIPAGARLLVAGESGSGKSTFANVLVRFLDYDGTYRIGGVEARDVDPELLRQRVGLIEQRAHLFNESIRQNLLFAKPDATDAELEAVIERVGLGGWMRSRGGLDAHLGERGSLVSGGQGQRIALARALLADFDVLVLDEPTANVDPGRADALVADLLDAAGSHTVVLISHTPIDERLISAKLVLG
ncbi:thiol reductant ABC exporter subunit CydC [Gulosibacter bifidus]|uniref:Thiol reductant ABC exporter subunit CydC n=1 Tax=Gulosibacter bifidus TaxID=272239 RepID=A0ABW5RK56_9MICO|nr:thiol reductant ABC exporter subunit CydC [Gulosibacter bifidus]